MREDLQTIAVGYDGSRLRILGAVEHCDAEAEQALLAAAGQADLLVLGSRGSYDGQRRLALGSVAAQLLRESPCSVLTTPA